VIPKNFKELDSKATNLFDFQIDFSFFEQLLTL